MNSSIRGIEDIYHKEIMLFEELLDCVEQERDSLIGLNTHDLWSIMEDKQRILQSIEDMREKTANDIPSCDMTVKDRETITELSRKLSQLKEEIRTRVKENVKFIRESLDFFHEIVTVLSTAGKPKDIYNPVRNNRGELPSLIYRNEV